MNEITIGGFKKFVKSANRIIDKISVTTGGALGFSSSFASEHKLDDYKGVVLYWNDTTKEIGIQFTATESDESLKLIKNKYGEGRTVNARAFFGMNHIDTKSKYKGRYSYRIVPFNQLQTGDASNESMYIIRLTENSGNEHAAPVRTLQPTQAPEAPDVTAGHSQVQSVPTEQPPAQNNNASEVTGV